MQSTSRAVRSLIPSIRILAPKPRFSHGEVERMVKARTQVFLLQYSAVEHLLTTARSGFCQIHKQVIYKVTNQVPKLFVKKKRESD